jgi:hypothetical protein
MKLQFNCILPRDEKRAKKNHKKKKKKKKKIFFFKATQAGMQRASNIEQKNVFFKR